MKNPGNVGLVVVVEYLVDSMAEELLSKFPDNSAYDFDYSQSSIWSPPVRRHFHLPPPPSPSAALTERKLDFEEGEEEQGVFDFKKASFNFKKKIAKTFNFHYAKMVKQIKSNNKKKRKNASFDLSPGAPTPKKVWSKILKVASKSFKKVSKKRDASSHIKLPGF